MNIAPQYSFIFFTYFISYYSYYSYYIQYLKSDRSSDHAANRWTTGPATVNVSLYKDISVRAADCNAATSAPAMVLGIK